MGVDWVYRKHSRVKIFFLFCLICLPAFFLSIQEVYAQDNPVANEGAVTRSGKPVVVDADDVEYADEQGMIIGRGNVNIDYEGVSLKADVVEVELDTKNAVASGNIIVYYDTATITGQTLTYNFGTKKGRIESRQETAGTESDSATVEIIAKDVTITSEAVDFDLDRRQAVARDNVILKQGASVLEGNRLVYNFNTEKGQFSGISATSTPWFARAEKGDKVSKEKTVFRRGYVTTCDIENRPHYRIQAKRIDYYIDDKIIAKNALLFVGNTPVMYFPYWRQSLKDGKTNISLVPGHTKEWGWFLLSAWRYYISEHCRGKVHLDYRQLKGFASGVDADYNTERFGQGILKTYYMNERDKESENEPANILQERERYRAQIKHRWEVDSSHLALIEYNKTSDIDFIRDYLYREYEEDVQPVSEASLAHYDPDYTLSLYARKRTNRFYSEVERLPELQYALTSRQLGSSNVYFRNSTMIANLNAKTAQSDIDTDVNRLDSDNELTYPAKFPGFLDWINITPRVGTRQTYYSKDVNGDEEDLIRGIHYYGFDMNTTFYRFCGYSGRPFGMEINRLRHILIPRVQFSYTHEPTVAQSKLGSFDEIDSLAKENKFTFGLENYLQTKWKREGSEEHQTSDLIYFYPHVDYTQNAPSGQRHFSFITTECNIRPYRWMHVDSDSVYNQYQRRFQTANIDFFASGSDKWRLGVGKRYDRDNDEQLTTDVYYKINARWQARAYARYLSDSDIFQEQQYTIYRDLHCWLLEMTYDLKLDDDGATQDRTFWFIFRLKAFPDETPIRFNVGYETTKRI